MSDNTTIQNVDSSLSSEDRIAMYNACGQGQYINTESGSAVCTACPTDVPATASYSDMCSDDVSVWLPAQVTANPRGDPNNTWQKINTVLMRGTTDVPNLSESTDILESWYNDRLTDEVISQQMSSNDYDGSLDQFKTEVSSGRGSTVHCIEPEGGIVTGYGTSPYSVTLDDNAGWPGCDPSGMFGPSNITMQEINEWSSQQPATDVEEQVEGTSGSAIDSTVSHGDVANVPGQELMTMNTDFEDCINDILRESDDRNYEEIVEQIHAANDIRDLTDEHIAYITRKLEILLTQSKDTEVKECIMQNYYNDETNPNYICSDNLAIKMSSMLNILFSTIGINLNINDDVLNDPTYKQKMMDIIDVVGDIIPRALDRILEITEDLEVSSCSEVTGKTQLLRELHTTLFRPEKRSVDINVDLDSLNLGSLTNIIKDESEGGFSDSEFNRTAILGGLALGLLKFL